MRGSRSCYKHGDNAPVGCIYIPSVRRKRVWHHRPGGHDSRVVSAIVVSYLIRRVVHSWQRPTARRTYVRTTSLRLVKRPRGAAGSRPRRWAAVASGGPIDSFLVDLLLANGRPAGPAGRLDLARTADRMHLSMRISHCHQDYRGLPADHGRESSAPAKIPSGAH